MKSSQLRQGVAVPCFRTRKHGWKACFGVPKHGTPVGNQEVFSRVIPVKQLGILFTAAAIFLFAVATAACSNPPPASSGPPPATSETPAPVMPIDLASALRLAGIDNPDILIARQRVVQALAFRQLAAAQFLPNLNTGFNFVTHTGPIQQATGDILKVNLDSLYVGAGADAVGSGTVNIPGVFYNVQVAQTIYNYLASRQQVAARRFANQAIQNEMLRRVASAYLELLRVEGVRGVAQLAQAEAAEVSRLTAAFAKVKQGRQADADRALTELDDRRIDHIEARQKVQIASARLAELLNLAPVPRLHPVEERLVPFALVPDPIPLPELLGVALLRRPELAQRRVAIRQALIELDAAKVLPFSPNLLLGVSGGTFGGGGNLDPKLPRFGTFDGRNDIDVVMYWTVQNMGLGNVALVRAAASRARQSDVAQIEVLNRVRAEVTQAHVRAQVEYARMLASEKAVGIALDGFHQELQRIKGNLGLPIELLDSFRLLNQARAEYLDAIVGYNQAQLDLYVALGQPPADTLARPVPYRSEKK
jgi:outer membrane protein TolC